MVTEVPWDHFGHWIFGRWMVCEIGSMYEYICDYYINGDFVGSTGAYMMCYYKDIQ